MVEATNLEAVFENLVINGPVEDLREFLISLEAKKNRARLCSLARNWHKKANIGHFVQEGNIYSWKSDYSDFVSCHTFEALVLTATATQFSNIKWETGDPFRFSLELARFMEPDCLSACLESLLRENVRVYSSVRAIVSAGLCPRPQIEQYGMGLIALKLHHSGREEAISALCADPNILEEDIWLLFETEGGGEISLAAIDKFSRPGCKWSDVLYCLQLDGTLPRARLLRSSLEALNRGFQQFRAGWFSRFHEMLKPTDSERFAMLEDYGRLLSSSVPPTVSFALAAWLVVDKFQPIHTEVIARYLSPCVLSSSKSTVLSALSLIEKACKRDKTFRKAGVVMALQALSQEDLDVQGRLLKLLNGQREIIDDEISLLVTQQLDMIAPSLVEGFASLAGTAVPVLPETREVYSMVDGACENFFRGEPLRIIDRAEDFVETALAFLESPFNPLSAEVLLEAVALGKVEALRDIGSSKVDSFLVKLARPLLVRVRKIEKQLTESYQKDASYFFLHFLLHFLGADSVPENYRACPQEYFQTLCGKILESRSFDWATKNFVDRLVGVLERSSKSIFTKIGMPSWDSGYVSAEDFLQQVKIVSSCDCFFVWSEPYLYVMRLPWAEHEFVLEKLSSNGYGGKFLEQSKKILSQLCAAANKYAEQDPYTRELQIIRELADSSDDCLAAIARTPGITTGNGSVVLLAFYNYPILSEAFFAEGAKECKRLVRWFEVSDLTRLSYFLPLALGIAPLKERAHFLLAVGCLLSAPEIKALVCDSLLISIKEGRLNPEMLGAKLGLLLHSEISMPKRVAVLLGEIAKVDSVHNDVVRQVLEFSLAGSLEDSEIGMPRELGALLEVLQVSLVKAGSSIENKHTRKYLESLKPGSKAGKLAKELLAC